MLLNKESYEVGYNDLIYDGSHPVDGTAVTVTLSSAATADGSISAGQVIDWDSTDDEYGLHAASGNVFGIVSEDTEYEAGDTEVVCAVYTTGTIRLSKVVTDVDLTSSDIETFREKGIFLK